MTVAIKNLAIQLGASFSRAGQSALKSAGLADLLSRTLGQGQYQAHDVNVKNILPEIQSLARYREVLNKIVNVVVDGMGYSGAILAVLDTKMQVLTIQAIAFNPIHRVTLVSRIESLSRVRIIGNSVSLRRNQDNLGVQTCLSGDTMITHDLNDLFQPVLDSKLSRRIQSFTGIKTCISVPLLLEGRVVGNLCAFTEKQKPSDQDLDALHFFGTHAAIAVQNSIVFERLSRKLQLRETELNELREIENAIHSSLDLQEVVFERVSRQLVLRETELNQLREIENVIHSSLDLQEVLTRILNGAIKLTKAEFGHVLLVGSYASDLVQRVSFPEGPKVVNKGTLGLTQMIIQDKRPKLISKLQMVEPQNKEVKQLTENDCDLYSYALMESQLGVPILLGEELIGVIHIASSKVGAFDKRSLDMLEQLAVQAAIAIRNAYQFKVERDMHDRFANLAQVVAMGDMASNMVHSINNWVGSVRVDLNYLERQHNLGKFSSDEFLELLDDMQNNIELTLAMAENIRKPFQPLTQEPIDVNECILNVLKKVPNEYSKIMIVNELETLPPITATRQLELVFENLLNNALQAMKDKNFGVLKFATRCSADGRWVEIIVKDSGPGLLGNLNENDIFKLGVTGRQDGLGYGLWWCDTFLKRWEGTIQLAENSSAGCRFLIRLPINTLS